MEWQLHLAVAAAPWSGSCQPSELCDGPLQPSKHLYFVVIHLCRTVTGSSHVWMCDRTLVSAESGVVFIIAHTHIFSVLSGGKNDASPLMICDIINSLEGCTARTLRRQSFRVKEASCFLVKPVIEKYFDFLF